MASATISPPSQRISIADKEWQIPEPGSQGGSRPRAKHLWADPATKRTLALLRFAPGHTSQIHKHVGDELIFVIEGALSDESGTVTAGNVGFRPDGCVHSVWSKNGATVLSLLNGGAEPAKELGGGKRSLIFNVNEMGWAEARPGVRQKRIWEDPATARMAVIGQLEPGASSARHRHLGEEMVFVVEGSIFDEFGEVPTGTLGYRPNGCVHNVQTRNGATAFAFIWGTTEPA
jgi:anti-sigma factor ChrR (cupin superfamily)